MEIKRREWIAVTCFLLLGVAFPALARSAKTTPLNVTYYYLPG
jgi:hypothetical protein